MVAASTATQRFRWLALSCHLSLLVWVSVWHLLLGSGGSARVHYSLTFILLLYVVPLLLPLRGIIKGIPYTHAWANFVVLFYIVHGLTIAYTAPSERVFAVGELVLATGMFVGCCAYARLRGREMGLKIQKLKEELEKEKSTFSHPNT